MLPQDIHRALMKYVERGDRTEWEAVLDAIRDGKLLVEVGATQIVIRPAPSPAMGRLAARLRQMLADSGLTQFAVAELCEVSTSTVARLMGAQTLPQWPIVAEVVRGLGGDPEEFRRDFRAARAERNGH